MLIAGLRSLQLACREVPVRFVKDLKLGMICPRSRGLALLESGGVDGV